jgi:hypothetical protein
MDEALDRFRQLPGRLLLDTCILNTLFDEGAYLWDGEIPDGVQEESLSSDLRALRYIMQINERASFQLIVSPLSVAEVANVQDFADRGTRVQWLLDVLDHWLIMLDEIGDRVKDGGTYQHRFKLGSDLQDLEARLMLIPDLRRDPFDRLLLVQYKMGNCDAFMTTDRNTIWRHRRKLNQLGIRVLSPSEFWVQLKPWAALWR